MSAVALLPLKTLNVASHLAKIKSLIGQANAYSKLGAPGLPGIPDLKSMVKKMLEVEAKKYLEEARTEALALLLGLMGGALIAMIPAINQIIQTINAIITGINATLNALAPPVKILFKIIIGLTIVYVVAKIVALIPAIVVAMGAGVGFTQFISAATEIKQICHAKLTEYWPIAFAIIKVMLMLLAIFSLFAMLMGLLANFLAQQSALKKEAGDAMAMTAADMGSTEKEEEIILVECTLPSGEVREMTPEDCLAAGGAFPPAQELLGQMNDLDKRISDLNVMLGACVLPDGTIAMMTPEDCAAAGGCFGCAIDPNLCWDGCQHGLDLDGSKTITCQLPDGANKDMTLGECNAANGIDLSVANLLGLLADLKSQRDSLCEELGPLCEFQLDKNIITSLMNPHDDVTIKNTTKHSGKRKGFYQSDNIK